MSHINKIEGIGVSHTKKLEAEGIKTAEQLLQAGSSPKHRQELAKKTGFSEHHILKWVNQADLFRVKESAGSMRNCYNHRALIPFSNLLSIDRIICTQHLKRTTTKNAKYTWFQVLARLAAG
jgi:Domain of unknown function (DUF4332)